MAIDRSMLRCCLASLALAVLAACGTAQFENSRLAAGQDNPERRTMVPADRDRPVILMAFSGGGSRAAALAEAVLREMSDTTYLAGGGRHALTDDVKLISSVSGGSVTAAWFGLHQASGLDELRRDFLAQDNMASLKLDAVNPITWFRLAFTGFSRIEALEQLFDRRLFHGAKLGELNQPGKPIVVLNATDMAGGETFAITPRRFDDICSHLDAMPVSTGVAASAAFPILLSPVNFINFSKDCAGRRRSIEWAEIDLSNPFTPYLDLPQYREARYTNDLRQGAHPYREIDFLHLLDGGLADNLGVNSLRSALIGSYDDAGGLAAINSGKIKKLVIIIVNARSDPPNKLYQFDGRPGTVSMLNTVVSAPIDANTASSDIALTALLTEIAKASQTAGNARFAGMKVYGVSVDYDQIPTDTPEHIALRDQAKTVPTSWTLSAEQLKTTEIAGSFLLRRHPCYRELLADLKAAQPPAQLSGAEPAVACLTKIQP